MRDEKQLGFDGYSTARPDDNQGSRRFLSTYGSANSRFGRVNRHKILDSTSAKSPGAY